MSFFIRDIEIKSKVVLGPMAGNTNYAYRKIAKENGCGLVYAEMVSDKALNFNNTKTLEMIKVASDEHPCSMQLFGSDVADLVKAAKFIDQYSNCDFIDINMGCPVNKVAKKGGAGSALLKDPKKVYEIVLSVVKSVKKPVTVKIRIGWDKDSINAVEIAKLIEKAGASAIAVHGRTREQLYSGKADWSIIKKVKDAVSIPVIGNGDINSALDAKKMMDETGVDAVMVARATLGNPFIFNEINEYLENGVLLEKPSYEAIYQTIKKHLGYLSDLKDEYITMLEMRRQIGYYMKGLPHATKVKPLIFKTKSIEETMEIVDNYFKQIIEEEKNK
ncbi:MAG: tRNA dihydrouridine synthase DusB [bacterium]